MDRKTLNKIGVTILIYDACVLSVDIGFSIFNSGFTEIRWSFVSLLISTIILAILLRVTK